MMSATGTLSSAGQFLDGTPDQRLQVQRTFVLCSDVSMRLLHPAMPFVTEVWDALPASGLLSHDAEFFDDFWSGQTTETCQLC